MKNAPMHTDMVDVLGNGYSGYKNKPFPINWEITLAHAARLDFLFSHCGDDNVLWAALYNLDRRVQRQGYSLAGWRKNTPVLEYLRVLRPAAHEDVNDVSETRDLGSFDAAIRLGE